MALLLLILGHSASGNTQDPDRPLRFLALVLKEADRWMVLVPPFHPPMPFQKDLLLCPSSGATSTRGSDAASPTRRFFSSHWSISLPQGGPRPFTPAGRRGPYNPFPDQRLRHIETGRVDGSLQVNGKTKKPAHRGAGFLFGYAPSAVAIT